MGVEYRLRFVEANSYELLNYRQLPRNASLERKIEALHRDREWLRSHWETMDMEISKVTNVLKERLQRKEESDAA